MSLYAGDGVLPCRMSLMTEHEAVERSCEPVKLLALHSETIVDPREEVLFHGLAWVSTIVERTRDPDVSDRLTLT